MSKTIDIDTQITKFIYNDYTLQKIKHSDQYSYKQIEQLRHNFTSLMIACMINKVENIAHFTVRKLSLDGKLRFIITENTYEKSRDMNQHSVTYAYLIADYLNKYLNNQQVLDPSQISCSYDHFSGTWTLTTDIPAL